MKVYHEDGKQGNKATIKLIRNYEQLEIIANEGLLALSVELGMNVMGQMPFTKRQSSFVFTSVSNMD